MNRTARIERKTTETDIQLELNLDGKGNAQIETGIGFFDHMLNLFARHGAFDLMVKATGDLHVDQHHLVEDVGLVLGQAFDQALGDKRGILRSGGFVQAMDESLAVVAVDFGGRTVGVVDLGIKRAKVGELETEALEEFFEALARGAKANVHAKILHGKNKHHKVEAVFKGLGRSFRFACSTDDRMRDLLPSTKELL